MQDLVKVTLDAYTPAEHRRALGKLMADIQQECNRPTACPRGCGGTLVYEPPSRAEPSVGVRAWRGGFNCDTCDYLEEREEVEDE